MDKCDKIFKGEKINLELIKELLLDFTKYLDLWNRCLNISTKIRIYAKEGDLDRLNLESENRQRLLNILKYHKEKILTKLDQNDRLSEPEFLKDFFQKVQRAAFETSSLIQTIDSETLDFLSLEKIKTSNTISKISKLKSYLEG
jgi:hypothetical protein